MSETDDEQATSQPRSSETWYAQFYRGVDAMDPTVIDEMCSPDTTVRFANHEEASGRDAVRGALQHFWSTIAGMRHTFKNVVQDGENAIIEAIVEYTRLDGQVVRLPVATAIDRRGGLITAQRIYIDLAPLVA